MLIILIVKQILEEEKKMNKDRDHRSDKEEMQNQNMGKCISLHHKKVMPK
jgi:hypothetical protein